MTSGGRQGAVSCPRLLGMATTTAPLPNPLLPGAQAWLTAHGVTSVRRGCHLWAVELATETRPDGEIITVYTSVRLSSIAEVHAFLGY